MTLNLRFRKCFEHGLLAPLSKSMKGSRVGDDPKSVSYRDAGVDIDAGEALVEAIKPLVSSTARSGSKPELGGFGGLFDLKAAGFKDPVLVAATDGVGTKLKIALEMDRLDSIGIDLVAMCVNDLVVQGAEPLFFLDYFATGKLDIQKATTIISGITRGCKMAGCALIGGESAEMPGLYAAGDFDLAGFSVGAVERGSLLDGSSILPGDVILGLASSGVHSNGFSLVRKLLEDNDITLSDESIFDGSVSYGEAILEPTRIYSRSLLKAHGAGLVRGLAHITGGGLPENLPRILPSHTAARLDADLWTLPPIFGWLRDLGHMTPEELLTTFNCGVGMALVVPAAKQGQAEELLREAGETIFAIGEIVEATEAGAAPHAEISGSAGSWGYDEAWKARTIAA